MDDVAAELGMSRPSAQVALNTLVRAGLVDRQVARVVPGGHHRGPRPRLYVAVDVPLPRRARPSRAKRKQVVEAMGAQPGAEVHGA